MTNQQPDALRLADELEMPIEGYPEATELERNAAAELRRLHAYCQELESQVILDCIEHVANDVSKNGAESNMGVAYAEPSEFPAGAIVNGRTHIDRLESFYRFDCEAGPLINCDDWHGLKRCFEHLAECASHGQAPATQQAGEMPTRKQGLQVAVWVLLDGKGGWKFSWDAQDERFWVRLSAPQPSTAAQAADSVLEDAARLERERICAAIKAEDDYCVDHGDYMLDSDDCIKIVRGEWVRPDFSVAAARKKGGK